MAWSSNNNRPPSAAGGGFAAAVVVAGPGQGKAGRPGKAGPGQTKPRLGTTGKPAKPKQFQARFQARFQAIQASLDHMGPKGALGAPKNILQARFSG